MTMEREKYKAGLVSETFEASLGKRMVVHLRPPNHPTTFVRGHRASRSPLSDGAPPPHQPAKAQVQDKHRHRTSTSTAQVQAQAQATDKHKPSATATKSPSAPRAPSVEPSDRETLRAT